jgi:CheY-like chemotaxis protein
MTQTLLVVDDNDAILETLADVLELEGFHVITARNGREALGALHGSRELPDLILLDLRMPVMDGAQFRAAQLLDDRLRTIPVVVLSADSSAGQAAKSLGLNCLRKPVDLGELLAAVRHLAPAA